MRGRAPLFGAGSRQAGRGPGGRAGSLPLFGAGSRGGTVRS